MKEALEILVWLAGGTKYYLVPDKKETNKQYLFVKGISVEKGNLLQKAVNLYVQEPSQVRVLVDPMGSEEE